MTREEAIEILRGILTEAIEYENSVCYVTEEDREPLEMAIEALENQKTGKWIGDWYSPKCSVCGKKPLYERYYGIDGEETSLLKSFYCPYCGAKMEEE